MIEEFDTMTARHKRERRELVEYLANQGLTQTQAAARLKVKLTTLNNYIHRNGIHWPVKKQGVKQNALHPVNRVQI